ncbi:tryptophan-rich sensory protein [Filimonas zeae]|uniref:Tryptophan-rich sensory protein n=1 Tax=Filimonas zeae TaxID=1737353 RepID=A0A917J2Q5_9BACT|nr:TspO/MBR family protein [Filimonas zeae]MDR6340804.1 tryptophan-rich sensory protein [Filimonas zeae]GGH78382.1 tryptophan-rich sensory protein [Filimonas zeae]
MKWGKLIISLAIPLAVGAVAGIATSSNVDTWYPQLNKPSFNPPNSVFGPVWTVLYILMGISLYLIWRMPVSFARNNALRLFFFQLALNFLWSFLFFEWHLIGWALTDIVLLLVSILFCIALFRRVQRIAAWLFVPYLLWVSFATALNFAIYRLN